MFANTHPNVWKIMLLKLIRWFMLIMPIIVLYFGSLGLSMSEIYLLQSVFGATMVLMEIPSGYMADVFNRKSLVVWAYILGALGFLITGIATGFWTLVIAQIVLGISSGILSGADTAILYETLLEEEQEDEFMKWQGRTSALGNLSESAAAIVGGLLATIALNLPALVHAGLTCIGIFVAMTLYEPKREKLSAKEGKENIRKIFSIVYENKTLFQWLVFSSLMGCTTLTIAWITQQFFINNNLPTEYFGVLWAVINLSVAFFSWNAHHFNKRFAGKTIALFVFGLAVFALLGLSFVSNWWGMIFFICLTAARGIGNPTYSDYINANTPSEMRATIMSMGSFGVRGIFTFFGPIYGYWTDVFSIETAMLFTAILLTIVMIPVFWTWRVVGE